MEQTQVSSSKMAVILAMFIASEFMVTYGNVNAGRDTWFALLLTVLGTLFLALLYYFLLTIIPQGDLFIALDQAFGKILGKLLIILYIAYGLIVATISFYQFNSFIRILSFGNTPYLFIALIVLTVLYFLLRSGLKAIIQLFVIIFPVFMAMLILSFLLLYPEYQFSNFLPLLKTPLKQIVKSSLSFGVVSFGDAILLTGLGVIVVPKLTYRKVFGRGIIGGGLMYLLAVLMHLLVFDAPLTDLLVFPTYSAIALIDVAQFITRIQVLLSSVFINAVLLKVLIGLEFALEGLKKLFPKGSKKFFYVWVLLVILGLSYLLFPNFEALRIFKEKYAWFKIVWQVGIPLLLLIVLIIRKVVFKKEFTDPSAEGKRPQVISR